MAVAEVHWAHPRRGIKKWIEDGNWHSTYTTSQRCFDGAQIFCKGADKLVQVTIIVFEGMESVYYEANKIQRLSKNSDGIILCYLVCSQ